MKNLVIKNKLFAFGLLALAFLVIYGKFNPENVIFFPKCIFKTITGFDCPGCGIQRAIHYLLNLEFGNAFRANAFFVLVIPYILVGFIVESNNNNKSFSNIRNVFYGTKAILIVFTVVIFWWIFRNL
jgi:hypothetical protein